MFIAIDIGNSSINIGFFIDGDLFVQKIATHPLLSPSDYLSRINMFIKEKNIDKIPEGIIISSVVPGHTIVMKETVRGFPSKEPLIVDYRMKTGLKFDIPRPEEVGADRIADSVAAYDIFKNAVAVADFGTATTISVVGKNATFSGGTIMPGLGLMNKMLARETAQLPDIPVSAPDSALGVDTDGNIRSGVVYGTAGAVERLLDEIEKEMGYELKVAVTGGYGSLISGFFKREHLLRPYLTLEGLKILYMENRDA